MEPKEIAQKLHKIDWVSVQCDSQLECERLLYLLAQVEKLSKEEALRLMLAVMEANALVPLFKDGEYNPFEGMEEFKYLSLNGWNTSDYK